MAGERFIEAEDDRGEAWRKASQYAAILRANGLAGPWLIEVRYTRLRRGATFVISAGRSRDPGRPG